MKIKSKIVIMLSRPYQLISRLTHLIFFLHQEMIGIILLQHVGDVNLIMF